MKSKEPGPPRWAEAMLRSLLRPSDRDSTSGDLLEEYRAVRFPALGARRADIWYVRQALSVLWLAVRPCALTIAGLTLFLLMFSGPSLAVRGPWNVSLVPVPAISLLHCAIYLWAGFRSAWRTRLIGTAILTAAVTSVVAFVVTFASLGIATPSLVGRAFLQPFVFVILMTCLLVAWVHGVVMGILGGITGRWLVSAVPPVKTRLPI